ncbi:hypothetical protein BMF77_04126 [Dolichospermum sp. UHCC 0315A]|jgi:hypothetical protein|uniref:hypothetical protein n=1 Tax=Dolichospermum TaxID=748770 RepID=UPI0011E6605A|nr:MULTISPECIES: hypothetical protein [Dolichospermum]MDB9437133.1 hypothetical protein [Dolichospermum lemmermannii CS-548]QEI43506.1 hypothetical protein BMF77_04126 [Dolichospermum sp. UHCC 0315A]
MSRTIKIPIANVINKIKSVIPIQENYTIYGDETCIDWLTYLKIDNKVRLFPDFYSAWFTYQNNNYLVLVNHEFLSKISNFLQEETLNPGSWVGIIDELDLSVKKDTDISKLEEILEGEWNINKKGYKEVNIEEEINGVSLKDYFPSIALYKIISRFSQKEELSQITGIVLTQSNGYCLLPYSPEVLQEFKNIFDNGNKYIPFENILASYVASDFKFAYLDLYRCIERLQPLYFFKPFYDKLGLTGKSLEEFYNDFFENTKLEPRFQDSFKKLLESINIDYRYEYPNKNNEQNTSPSSYLNNLRNQIVHLRPNQKNDLLPETADNWNILILDVLRIVQKLYEDNQNLLS